MHITFPFLIGKVLTKKLLLNMKLSLRTVQFPFLIGKVLTKLDENSIPVGDSFHSL